MSRLALLALVVVLGSLVAQDRPRPAKLKKYDPERSVVVLTVDGTDGEYTLTTTTRVMDASMKAIPADSLKAALKDGASVMFLAAKRDGKNVLVGLRVDGAALSSADVAKLRPLMELGEGKYQGFVGGLYPDGKNVRPEAHEKAGLALAAKVEPLDGDGKPSKDGKIVLMSVGMSNTNQVFGGFKPLADRDTEKNPRVVVVNGAQGGMTAARIMDPESDRGGKQYWTQTDKVLKAAGVTPAQVQVIWIKQADAGPSSGFPAYARTLQSELATIVRLLPKRFPNVKLVYVSSRTYGGYATTKLNPEPYAYESAFSVKWLIEDQLKGKAELNYDPAKGKVVAPWLSWGPYLWANGEKKNSEGLSSARADFREDGTHHTPQGSRKMGERLLMFFKSDTTAKPWFVAR